MGKIRKLFIKYREIILYVFFGGLTTLVNFASYALLARLFHIHELAATVIAFLLSVLFAYLTNRKWVFQSTATGGRAIAWESLTFFGGRAFSGVLDFAIMLLFVTRLGFNDMLIKLLSNVLVILVNYVISKLLVFRKRS